MKRIPLFLLTISLSLAAACGSSSTPEAPTAQSDTRIYECPMHCVKQGETQPYTHVGPADCPVCGMHLEPRAEQPASAPAAH
jgi:hypothetical protein